jgi:hypothetical protein
MTDLENEWKGYNGSIGYFIGCYYRPCPTPKRKGCEDDPDVGLELVLKDGKIVRAYVACAYCNADCGDADYHDMMSVLWNWDMTEEHLLPLYEQLINEYGEPRKVIFREAGSDGWTNLDTIKYEGDEEE